MPRGGVVAFVKERFKRFEGKRFITLVDYLIHELLVPIVMNSQSQFR